jgi:purine-binding chemotaxis protein CheW
MVETPRVLLAQYLDALLAEPPAQGDETDASREPAAVQPSELRACDEKSPQPTKSSQPSKSPQPSKSAQRSIGLQPEKSVKRDNSPEPIDSLEPINSPAPFTAQSDTAKTQRPPSRDAQPSQLLKASETRALSTAEASLSRLEKQRLQSLLDQPLFSPAPEPLDVQSLAEASPLVEVPASPPVSVVPHESPSAEQGLALPSSAPALAPQGLGQPPLPSEAPGPALGAERVELALEAPALQLHAWKPNGRPGWAQSRFDVLLLRISGLAVAVPLVVLGNIYPLGDKLNRLPGQSAWFMGILPSPRGQVRVVNTAAVVMAEKAHPDFVHTAKYAITLGVTQATDSNAGSTWAWGLAVDAVEQPVSLAPEDVLWRSERSKRAWLAGTVKSHMCALLDVCGMAEVLRQAAQREAMPRL